jgi:hypothetical protein
MYNDRMAGKAMWIASSLTVAPHEPLGKRDGSFLQK